MKKLIPTIITFTILSVFQPSTGTILRLSAADSKWFSDSPINWKIVLNGEAIGKPLAAANGYSYVVTTGRALNIIAPGGLSSSLVLLPATPLPYSVLGTDNTLYLFFSNRLMQAYTSAGRLLWQKELEAAPITPVTAAANGLLYFINGNHRLIAINHLGTKVWWRENPMPAPVAPIICGDRLIVADFDRGLHAFTLLGRHLLQSRQADRIEKLYASADTFYSYDNTGNFISYNYDGEQMWRIFRTSLNSVTLANADIWLGYDSVLQKINASNGAVSQTVTCSAPIVSPFFLSREQHGFIITDNSSLLILDTQSSQEITAVTFDNRVAAFNHSSDRVIICHKNWSVTELTIPPLIGGWHSADNGGAINAGPTNAVDAKPPDRWYQHDFEYIRLHMLVESGLYQNHLNVIKTIEESRELAIQNGYSEIYQQILLELCEKEIFGRLTSDQAAAARFALLRIRAARQLTYYATLNEREKLYLFLENETNNEVSAAIIRLLTYLASDEQANVARLYSDRLNRLETTDGRSRLISELLQFIVANSRYHGRIVDPTVTARLLGQILDAENDSTIREMTLSTIDKLLNDF